jgi:hypothetical protein
VGIKKEVRISQSFKSLFILKIALGDTLCETLLTSFNLQLRTGPLIKEKLNPHQDIKKE